MIGKRSSFCQDGGCVEVEKTEDGNIRIGDGDGNHIEVPASDWPPFIEGVKAGEFDPDKL